MFQLGNIRHTGAIYQAYLAKWVKWRGCNAASLVPAAIKRPCNTMQVQLYVFNISYKFTTWGLRSANLNIIFSDFGSLVKYRLRKTKSGEDVSSLIQLIYTYIELLYEDVKPEFSK